MKELISLHHMHRKSSRDFSKKLKRHWPVIIQAPMAGGITTPGLVAAVSNSGGLGSFAAGYLETEQVREGILQIKKLTNEPFSVNLFVPSEVDKNIVQIKDYQKSLNKFRHQLGMKKEDDISDSLSLEDNFREIVDVLVNEQIEIVSFTFGNLPLDVIEAFKKNGTYLIGTATSLEEAKILADSGIDAIIAQGYEAGGHRGGFFTSPKSSSIGTMALIPQLVDHINLPIIGAGGIMDGRAILAALSLGAAGVQMGTAFLTTQESGANQVYKSELIKTKTNEFDSTTLTKAYSGKLARGIKTRFIEQIEEDVPCTPDYPIPHILSSPIRKEAAKQKKPNMMSMWAGQGIPLITENLTADQFLEKVRNEFNETLQSFSTLYESEFQKDLKKRF